MKYLNLADKNIEKVLGVNVIDRKQSKGIFLCKEHKCNFTLDGDIKF